MSGGLIASAVATHSPRMAIEETAPDFVRGLIAGSREMGEAVRGLDPDLIVLQSAHWVSTFNWYVTAHAVHEGVCMAEEAPDLIPGIPYRLPGDPDGVDFEDVFGALKKIGYDRFVTHISGRYPDLDNRTVCQAYVEKLRPLMSTA